MSPRFISSLSAMAALAAIAVPASAIVIDDNVNQIQGSVGFSNANLPNSPVAITLSSQTVGISPTRSASTSGAVSGNSANYSLTVLANDLTHYVSPVAYFDSWRDVYYFAPKTSTAVANEPAAATNLGFSECAGQVSVEFYDINTGDPVAVPSVSAYAYPEVSPGNFGGEQAHTSNGNTSAEKFPVRGDGSNYRIDVYYRVGLLSYVTQEQRVVTCDADAQPIRIGLSDGPPYDLSQIDGYVDLHYKNEIADTQMVATWGPAGHTSIDYLSGSPASGDFLIENLVPSDAVTPSDSYNVYANMRFTTGNGIESFTSPYVEAMVPEGQTYHTNNDFIMDAGYVDGNIGVRGPTACLQAVDRMNRSLSGPRWGSASVDLAYAMQPDPDDAPGIRLLSAAYDLAVGAPQNTTEAWTPWFYEHFASGNPAPKQYLASGYSVYDNKVGSPLVAPGSTNTHIPVNHCLAQVMATVTINSADPAGTTFNNPRVTYGGRYIGEDGSDYSTWGDGYGTPLASDPRAQSGRVNLCVPAGSHTFDATVSASDENGVISDTQLRHVTHDIECGAIVNPLVVSVDTNPACNGAAYASHTASSKGFFEPKEVREMYAVVNCSEADMPAGVDFDATLCPVSKRTQICGNGAQACGEDPQDLPFSIPTAGLQMCGQTLLIVAIDDETGDASVSASKPFAVELQGPTGAGCDDVIAKYDNVLKGGVIDLELATEPLNACGLESEPVKCSFSNGTKRWTFTDDPNNPNDTKVILPGGQYSANCQLQTDCGTRTCSFDATVTQ